MTGTRNFLRGSKICSEEEKIRCDTPVLIKFCVNAKNVELSVFSNLYHNRQKFHTIGKKTAPKKRHFSRSPMWVAWKVRL